MKEYWDVHEHRDELQATTARTVRHPERGVLCWYEHLHSGKRYHPVIFRSRDDAWRWIREGTIAEIQERMSYLQVTFSVVLVEPAGYEGPPDIFGHVERQAERIAKLEAERQKLIELFIFDEDCDRDWLDDDDLIANIIETLVRKATERPGEFQHELFKVVHEGGDKYRNRLPWGIAETVFAEYWKEYNKHHDVAEAIVGQPFLTQRDASLIADVIQWLGTNCGSGFLRECERRIAAIDEQWRIVEHASLRDMDVVRRDRARAVANGVIQKMAISSVIWNFKQTIGEATQKSIDRLRELAGVRAFDVQE